MQQSIHIFACFRMPCITLLPEAFVYLSVSQGYTICQKRFFPLCATCLLFCYLRIKISKEKKRERNCVFFHPSNIHSVKISSLLSTCYTLHRFFGALPLQRYQLVMRRIWRSSTSQRFQFYTFTMTGSKFSTNKLGGMDSHFRKETRNMFLSAWVGAVPKLCL